MIGEKGADLIKGYKQSPIKVRPGKMKMPKKLAKAMAQEERDQKQGSKGKLQQTLNKFKTKFGIGDRFNEIIHRKSLVRRSL